MKTYYIVEGTRIDGHKEYGVLNDSKTVGEIFDNQQFIRLKKTKVPTRLVGKRLSHRDIQLIVKSLCQLLENGLSVYDAVNLLIHDNSKIIFRYIYISLRQNLRNGGAFSEALQLLHPLISDFFISIVKASEKSGQFLSGLQELEKYYAEQVRREEYLKKIVRYPKIVLGFSLIFGLGILVFIVPMFSNIYRLQGDNLPILTKGLVILSEFLRSYPFLISGGTLTVIFGSRRLCEMEVLVSKFKRWFKFFSNGQVGDQWFFSYALAILLKNGMDLLEALDVVGDNSTSDIKEKIKTLKKLLNKGLCLSDALKEVSGFSDIFYHSILSAEGVGKLHLGFEQVCTYLKRKSEERFQALSRLIEPLVMVLLGVMVFVLLLGIYLSIFDMGNFIS